MFRTKSLVPRGRCTSSDLRFECSFQWCSMPAGWRLFFHMSNGLVIQPKSCNFDRKSQWKWCTSGFNWLEWSLVMAHQKAKKQRKKETKEKKERKENGKEIKWKAKNALCKCIRNESEPSSRRKQSFVSWFCWKARKRLFNEILTFGVEMMTKLKTDLWT